MRLHVRTCFSKLTEVGCGRPMSHIVAVYTAYFTSMIRFADVETLGARLVGGREDPGGAWAYGRLEVFDGDFFSSISEPNLNQRLGRRGSQAACRSLGFATGVQILSGEGSGLPGADGSSDTLGTIACLEDAATLADCTLIDYGGDVADAQGDSAVALLCHNPSGATPSPDFHQSICSMTHWQAACVVVLHSLDLFGVCAFTCGFLSASTTQGH